MAKLREAILGKNGNNLDDLGNMDGMEPISMYIMKFY